MVRPDVFEKLAAQDWKSIYPALVTYALMKIKKLKWRSTDNKPPSGLEPEDIAKDAIASLYEGRRNWDPSRRPDILKHLKSIVDSNINHLVYSSEHLRRVYVQAKNDNDEDQLLENLQIETLTPFDEISAKNLIENLRKDVEGDEMLETILLCIEEGIDKPSDIAELFNLKVEDVNNGQKRLRRMAEKYRKDN